MFKKGFIRLTIAGFFMSFALLGCVEENVLPIGTKVKIIKDVRKGEPATGKIAEYVGGKKEGWLLIDENGKVERESWNLPDGYIEWDPKTQDWPAVKSGIKGENPVFRLEDGSKITGLECYWEPVDKDLLEKELEDYQQMLDKIKKMQEKK